MGYSVTFNFATHEGQSYSIAAIPMVTSDFAPTPASGYSQTFTNITSPLGKEENVRIDFSHTKNIYTNSGIESNLWTPSRRGVNLYFQVRDVVSAANLDDASAPAYDMPLKGSLSLTLPANDLVTAEIADQFLRRLLGLVYANAKLNWDALLRGSTSILK